MGNRRRKTRWPNARINPIPPGDDREPPNGGTTTGIGDSRSGLASDDAASTEGFSPSLEFTNPQQGYTNDILELR